MANGEKFTKEITFSSGEHEGYVYMWIVVVGYPVCDEVAYNREYQAAGAIGLSRRLGQIGLRLTEIRSKFYDELQSSYLNLERKYDALEAELMNKLNIFMNLTYVFLVTTLAFMLTTIFFAKRKEI